MKKTTIYQITGFFFLWILYPLAISLGGQASISLDPGVAIIDAPNPPNMFLSSPIQVSVISSYSSDWSITCLAEPLVHEKGDYVIPVDRIFMEHNYTGGSHVPLNTSVFLGNGNATKGYEIINRVIIKVHVLDIDRAGTYHGLLRLKSDVLGDALLPIDLMVHESMNFNITHSALHFRVSGPPGLYPCEEQVLLNYNGNTTNWQLRTQIDPITPQPANITIQCGQLPESQPDTFSPTWTTPKSHMVFNGEDVAFEGHEKGFHGSIPLDFNVCTDTYTLPGTYSTLIHLWNHVSEQISNRITLHVFIEVLPFFVITYDKSSVDVGVSGAVMQEKEPEGLPVRLFTNTNKCDVQMEIVQDLSSSRDVIPRERLLLYSSFMPEEGFRPFPDTGKLTIAYGAGIRGREKGLIFLKAVTTLGDIAGMYRGKLRFLVVQLP
jgi:hypothetical protein